MDFDCAFDFNLLKSLEYKTILFIGKTGSGKSTLIMDLLNLNIEIGHTSSSCTNDIQIYKNHNVVCIDTPGLSDTANRDQLFLNMLYEKLKGIKFDICCYVVDVDRRADANYKYLTNLYLQMLNITDQKLLFVYTKDVENDFMIECLNHVNIYNNYNFKFFKYFKTKTQTMSNVKPNIHTLVNLLNQSTSNFQKCVIKKN